MIPAFGCFVIGIVALSILSHFPYTARFFVPIFILLLVPCIVHISRGLIQLIKYESLYLFIDLVLTCLIITRKKHYTHVSIF